MMQETSVWDELTVWQEWAITILDLTECLSLAKQGGIDAHVADAMLSAMQQALDRHPQLREVLVVTSRGPSS